MSKSNPFLGRWRITEMELWDRADFDSVESAHFTFEKNGLGDFQFIAVQGGMDCRFSKREDKPFVEFTWLGYDETDPVSGRGWALLNGDEITGRIFFHTGDDSTFTARRNDAAGTRGNARRTDSKGSRNPGGGPRQ